MLKIQSGNQNRLLKFVFCLILILAFYNSNANPELDTVIDENSIIDEAHLLTNQDIDSLNTLLLNYKNNESLTFVIHIKSKLDADAALLELNRLGSSMATSNCVFILFNNLNSKAYIKVSPNLSSKLSEKFCAQVSRQIIEASFKQHQYYEGLKGALLAFSGTIQGNYKLKPDLNPEYSRKAFVIPVSISIAFVLAAILASAYSENKIRRLMRQYDIPDFNARIILGAERPVNPENGGWDAFKGGGEAGQW